MTTGITDVSAQPDQLLHDAAAWRLISLLFECPQPDWLAHVTSLGLATRDERLSTAARAAETEASEGLHHSLFGPGGPVSPREVTYSNGVQLGYLLSELNAYYEAFAYRPKTIEPEDHLSVEVGFMAYLAMKQAYALASGDEESARIAGEAATQFIADHLSRMVEPVARALEIGGPPYLVLAAQALYERVGPAPKTTIPLNDLSVADDDDSMTCATT